MAVKSIDPYFEVTLYSCLQVMALQEENLAYVAEHDPVRALKEYRRRKAAKPQQKVHAPVTLAKQGKKSDSAAGAEVWYQLVPAISLYSKCSL